MSQLFTSGGQRIRASASVLPVNIQGLNPKVNSFRIDWFDLLAIPETLRSLLQHHNSKSSILWCSAFFNGPTLTSVHDYWKNHCLTRWTLVGKVMSLFYNMLSKFVIAFLPRSKYLLISWLHSPYTVILEDKKIKSVTVSTFSPSIYHEVMRLFAMILVI